MLLGLFKLLVFTLYNITYILVTISYSVMVQYHALGLMYHIRKTDRLAVIKLVTKLTKQSLKSPFAVCLLVSIQSEIEKYQHNIYLLYKF